jgi:hypothetical protein
MDEQVEEDKFSAKSPSSNAATIILAPPVGEKKEVVDHKMEDESTYTGTLIGKERHGKGSAKY